MILFESQVDSFYYFVATSKIMIVSKLPGPLFVDFIARVHLKLPLPPHAIVVTSSFVKFNFEKSTIA